MEMNIKCIRHIQTNECHIRRSTYSTQQTRGNRINTVKL